ncbi:hypothetical protein MANES_02G195350v8 [Manihot esculenta]|uniref:Uncharacterized protein n=1 Tax=Manihot esculenta TaxID=3983 RepID=A0ACB7IA92_MANES|nr:hypothetical protein MANES_02G195350v8 [Manihot esculenta]
MSPDDLAKILTAITTKSNETDPYQIHSSEAPGFSIVSVPLKGPNYISWSRAVQIALRAKKKLGFVNGTIKAPEPDSDDYEKWATADSMVVSWLLNAMSKDISDAFVFLKNAKVLWDELKQCYGESNGPMIYQIERDIAAPLPVCCETGTAISDYDNNRRLVQFLMGLGDEYDNVKNQVLLQSPLPSINKAYSMVMSVEKQREVQTSNATFTETAVVMMARRGNNNYSDNTSSLRNNNRYSSYPRKEDKKKEYCTKCKIGGHTIEDYSSLQQHVPSQKSSDVQDNAVTNYIQQEFQKFLRAKGGFPDPAAEDVRNVNFAGTLLNSVITGIDFNCKDNWIIDSGATDYITPKLSFFDQVVQLNPSKTIRLPDKTTRKDLQTEEVLGEGRVIEDFYFVTRDSFNKQISCFSVAGCNEHDRHLAMLWHARLGHVAHKRLKHVAGIFKCDYADLICSVCPIAKQTRIPFSTSRISTKEVFDLLHVDLWGPYHLKSITNVVYILTIVDDFSWFCWTYMLKSKEQVFSALKNFFHYVFTKPLSSLFLVLNPNSSIILLSTTLPCKLNEYHTHALLKNSKNPMLSQIKKIKESKE